MSELVSMRREGMTAIVSLSRPEKRNALNRTMLRALERIAGELHEDDARAVLIRAEGAAFSVGADLREPPPPVASLETMRRRARNGTTLLRALREIPQPTICAMQGAVNGAGACIALSCDVRIVATDVRFALGEVAIGINLSWNALAPLVALAGPARAKRLAMGGETIGAEEMLAWGLADAVVAPEALDTTAREWAERYAALPPVAAQMIKQSINALAENGAAAILHADADQCLLTLRTADFVEGIRAFAERRPGRFTGD